MEPLERPAPLVAIERPAVNEERDWPSPRSTYATRPNGSSANLRASRHQPASLGGEAASERGLTASANNVPDEIVTNSLRFMQTR